MLQFFKNDCLQIPPFLKCPLLNVGTGFDRKVYSLFRQRVHIGYCSVARQMGRSWLHGLGGTCRHNIFPTDKNERVQKTTDKSV